MQNLANESVVVFSILTIVSISHRLSGVSYLQNPVNSFGYAQTIMALFDKFLQNVQHSNESH